MEQLFTYLIKSGGLLAVFYVAYHFLVRKETFFNSNRWFLLGGLITSLLLPLYFIKKIIIVEPTLCPTSNVVHNAQQPPIIIPDIPVAEPFNWLQFLCVSYLLIVGILVVRMLFNFVSLYRMLYNQQVTKREGFKFINLNKNIAPFSFFNYIVYNPDLYSDDEVQSILLHEKIHSREKHSADIIITELFCSVFWINPIAWLYKKAITQNLEYIADQKAIEQLEDKKSYQHALLKVVSNQNCLPITNNFYQSLIKKRIVMLNKNQSHRRSSRKYALVIPALIGFVLLFQVKTEAKERKLAESTKSYSANLPLTDKTWTKNTTDSQFNADAKIMADANIIFDFTEIKRNSKNEITSITISFSDELGNNSTDTFTNTNGIKPIRFIRDINNGKGQIGYLGDNDIQKENVKVEYSGTFSTVTTLVFDKISSDEELKSSATEVKENHNIDLTFSNVKRNEKGEIITIKIAYNDNNGKKGKVEQIRTIPIRPIFFKAITPKDGKTVIGFYDNSDMTVKPLDPVNEGKIITVESIKDDAIIYVDGQRYTKEDLNELDPKGLERIEILTDLPTLTKYGAKDKGSVVLITTNWTTRQEPKPNPVNIITIANGDEVVVYDRFYMKVPGYPTVQFTEKSPVLVINGVQKNNPRLLLESMNLMKIKDIKVLNDSDKEVKGAPISKVVITLK
ncbi:MAG: M56 family metallopeptidase [Flavobacterium sp. JAD_PAG50586_2]|nr:MAG: M56 family metallopeptidase [Flavobacterium sp. JAD_PAG50586_2]